VLLISLDVRAPATFPPLAPTTLFGRTRRYSSFFLSFFLPFFFLSLPFLSFLFFFAIRRSFLQDMVMWPTQGRLLGMSCAALFGLELVLQRLFRSLTLIGVSLGTGSSPWLTVRHYGIIRQIEVMSTGLWAVRIWSTLGSRTMEGRVGEPLALRRQRARGS
jgi:hypothetical protein